MSNTGPILQVQTIRLAHINVSVKGQHLKSIYYHTTVLYSLATVYILYSFQLVITVTVHGNIYADFHHCTTMTQKKPYGLLTIVFTLYNFI